MSQALQNYIERARKQGHDQSQIESDLLEAGWTKTAIETGFTDLDRLMPPPPPGNESYPSEIKPRTAPQAVVTSFTTRGLEYMIMFIAMGVAALSLGSVLHSTVNTIAGTQGGWSDGVVSFATSALIVALPVFAFLFLRLKRAELAHDNLYQDNSRRRAVQLTLIITFLIGLGNIIFYLYTLLNGGSSDNYNLVGEPGTNGLLGNTIHLLITLTIAGGIFTYYWIDDHRHHRA